MAGALNGLKILDFTTLLPGPFATMSLADMGADVLRVVSGTRPDLADMLPPRVPGTKMSAASAQLGRNKKLITLNFKDKRAIEVIHKLLAEYDIVIEQFRPGVMDKLGLGYESLKTVNPRLIYCSLTGYGQTGPLSKKAGHDMNYIALSGMASYSGTKKNGPSLFGMQVADVASGSNNTMIGLLAAVIYRQNTGKGQHVDISMTDGMVAFNASVGASFLVDGKEVGREGMFLNGGSVYDYYKTKDEQYVTFGGLEPQFFKAFCETIGRPDLIEGGCIRPDAEQVKEEIREIMATKTRDEWTDVFKGVDACFEPVLSLTEAFASEQVKARNMVVEVPGPNGVKVKQIGSPIKFSETSPEYRSIGKSVADADTNDIMRTLGYSDAEIDAFEKEGVFGTM
ncbi:MAG TPA: CaiB/BaiF CoA-transferase family protein [Syntrophomonas sp.]|nr:CaiB/BaiF CoA-transferase family protein [Syntrophomonas sp.]